MKYLMLLTAAIFLTWVPQGFAHDKPPTSHPHEYNEELTYAVITHNCGFSKYEHRLTKRLDLRLKCDGQRLPNDHQFTDQFTDYIEFNVIESNSGNKIMAAILLKVGDHFNRESESTKVTLKVDDNETYTTLGIFADETASSYVGTMLPHKDYLALLDQMANGMSLYVTVGDHPASISLEGTTEAIVTFKEHIANMPPTYSVPSFPIVPSPSFPIVPSFPSTPTSTNDTP